MQRKGSYEKALFAIKVHMLQPKASIFHWRLLAALTHSIDRHRKLAAMAAVTAARSPSQVMVVMGGVYSVLQQADSEWHINGYVVNNDVKTIQNQCIGIMSSLVRMGLILLDPTWPADGTAAPSGFIFKNVQKHSKTIVNDW